MTIAWRWLLLVCLLVGCQFPGPLPTSTVSKPLSTRLPLETIPDDGDGLSATLNVDLEAGAGYWVQTLPATWDTAVITLSHPTALNQARVVTLSKGGGIVASGSTYVATGSLGVLRPTSGYTLTVDLWNGGSSGTLAAEKQQTINLVAGANNVTVSTDVFPTLGLTAYSPTSGINGDSIVLTGQGFSVLSSQDQVTLGPSAITLTAASSVSLTALVPDIAPNTYSWNVQVGSSLAGKTGFNVLGTIGSTLKWVTLSSAQTQPAIVHGSDRYLVAWTDNRNSNNDIYGRLVDASGSTLVSDFAITAGGSQTKPDVAYNSSANQFLVVYQDGANSNDIRGQLVNPDGTPVGSNFGICTLGSSQTNPHVTYGSTKNQYLVAWTDNRNGSNQIYGQIVNANGTLSGGNIAIDTSSTKAGMDNVSAVYAASSDKFLVTWRNDNQPMIIKAGILNSDGTFNVSPFVVSPVLSVDQDQPTAAYDPVSGNFIVAWVSTQSPYGTYAQRVSGTGGLVGSSITVSSATSTSKNFPSIAYESWRQKYVIVWNDQRNSNWDIYGQFVATNGSLWGVNFNVSSGAANQNSCSVDVDPTNKRGLVAFQDASNGNDVYGQLVR